MLTHAMSTVSPEIRGDINLYGYVWNNPLTYTDPYGLLGTKDFWIPAGEQLGDEALDYYAGILADSCSSTGQKVGAAVGGFFAALWTSETWNATATTLAGTYLVRLFGPFTTRGLPSGLQRLRQSIRFDRPTHGRGWEFDGTIPRWIRSWFQ